MQVNHLRNSANNQPIPANNAQSSSNGTTKKAIKNIGTGAPETEEAAANDPVAEVGKEGVQDPKKGTQTQAITKYGEATKLTRATTEATDKALGKKTPINFADIAAGLDDWHKTNSKTTTPPVESQSGQSSGVVNTTTSRFQSATADRTQLQETFRQALNADGVANSKDSLILSNQ